MVTANDLSVHKQARDEEHLLAPQLAKLAEVQLKTITTALKQYHTKHREEFPLREMEDTEWHEGRSWRILRACAAAAPWASHSCFFCSTVTVTSG
jgi:hypothetical protein